MSHIVVLGAGLGGSMMTFEMKKHLSDGDTLTVINKGTTYQFVPSNPWVALGLRKREDIEVDLCEIMHKKHITLEPSGAKRVYPAENRVELNDGRSISYDYLIIATGPDLAFNEISGLGPDAHTVSICQTSHAEKAFTEFEKLAANPAPVIVGAAQGASCFGPAYEFAFILDNELRKRKVRDRVPMTFVTPEPYIGHLGLDGVGDTKGLLESEMRKRHIKWITNSRIKQVEAGKMQVEELSEDGSLKANHDLPFSFSMILPAFKGIEAIQGIEGLVNPRGFVLINEFQQNPTYKNVFAIGVCVAIPPIGKTPVPVGVPKTGFMIESMVDATAINIKSMLEGKEPHSRPSWNAICLADFGDGGVAFIAQPQIPPRNVNWSSSGKWVHLAKVGFEKYFMHKVRHGESLPFYEKLALDIMGIERLKDE